MRLTIDPNIVPKWGLWEAFREILQGAIDSGCEYKLEYDENGRKLTVANKGKLEKRSLLIGNSDKREDETTIGEHGEGYKLAAAILLRNNKPFFVYNNDELWHFTYKYDRAFKTTIVDVNITKWFVKTTGLITWEIGNISPEEYESLIEKTVQGGDIRGGNGFILLDRPGQIFSKGLYVTYSKDLTFGYNFDLGTLKLQRDRDLISHFDLHWATSQCWRPLEDAATHIRNGVEDVKFLDGQYHSSIADATHSLFVNEYGKDAVPCAREEHKVEGRKNVIVNSNYRAAIVASSRYTPPPVKKRKTPTEILSQWYIESGLVDDRFKEIIEESENWVAI